MRWTCLVAGLWLGARRAAGAGTASECRGLLAISTNCHSAESAYRRDSFHVGGTSLLGDGGTITSGQLYVEKLTPVSGVTQLRPLVFIHGGGPSGTTWLNTPDNRQGWASYFVQKGYQVYLVDSTAVGRSSDRMVDGFTMSAGSDTLTLQQYFTAPEHYNAYPQALLHTQWPGTGLEGDPFFDAFQHSFLPITYSFEAAELAHRAAGCELLSMLGAPSYLVSHSLGGKYAILLANDCPQYIAATVNLEPAITPFRSYDLTLQTFPSSPWGMTYSRVDYDPPVSNYSELVTESVGDDTLQRRSCYRQVEPARRLPNIASVPYLMITSQASIHATYDACTIAYLEQVGASPEWIRLADRGIEGNGHFMHLEKNNLDVAALVDEWIVAREARPRLKMKCKSKR